MFRMKPAAQCLQRDWKWAFLVCIRKLPWNSVSQAYRLTRTCVCQLRGNLSLVDAEMPATWLQGTSVVSQSNCHLALSEGLCITDLENELLIARCGGGCGEGIVRDFGKVMYTLLYLKWTTNKDLLNSTWNSVQCFVPGWTGWGFGENKYVYMYSWVPVLLTWNFHNVVDQLYPNTKCFWN